MKLPRLGLKKGVIFGTIVLLFVICGTLLAIAAYQSVEAKMASLETKQSELTKRVEDFTYSPSSLNECINVATTEYSSYIKSEGDPTIRDGQTTFSLSEQEWKNANAKYESAKVSCQNQFGKTTQ